MPDVEKIINGLEGIVAYFRSSFDAMSGTYACEIYRGWAEAAEQAIALLKAQEPRVMTLEELSEKTDVYFESSVYDTIDPALSSGSYDDGTVGLMTLAEELFYMDEADYGTKWRCWTSRPTDEQREAVKWE